MNIFLNLTPEEAEELTNVLFEHYRMTSRKRAGKKSAETAMKFWARLECEKRNAEPKDKDWRECSITFQVTDEQYRRLCVLCEGLADRTPETVLSSLLTVGSYHLINDRLDFAERALINDQLDFAERALAREVEREKGESG